MPVAQTLVSLPERYRIVAHIASGGMAHVWSAEDELLGRLVAVKMLAGAYAADELSSKRFQREARAAAQLSDHPHVVTIYDVGEHDDRPFMVMEYMAGGSVQERLRSARPIPQERAVRWVQQAARALDAAHMAGIVHRDVKPANLLLDEAGRLAIADFGIATLPADTALTRPGDVLGTAGYLSPEQALGKPATAAADRYALAVVAFELLTGSRPFGGSVPAAQARAHIEDEPPNASFVNPTLPWAVDDVFARGLAKDPADRPGSARLFVAELEEALAATPGTNTAVTQVVLPPPVPSAPASATHPKQRRALVLAALLAFAVVTVALATSGGSDPVTEVRSAATTAPAPTTPAHKAPAKPTLSPSALNDRGFALIQASRYAEAVPLLQQSVSGFRERGQTGEITYAYALYNLANALRLSGRPAEAIRYLQERLRITDDQRDTVRTELALALQAAGLAPSGKPGKGPKPGKGHRDDG